jgi:hypothetical protein
MQPIFSLILLASIIFIARSQTWDGSYTVQPGCDTKMCCCPHEQLTVTRASADVFNVHISVTGQCTNLISYQSRVPDPKGYSGSIEILGQNLNITLSPDSRTMNITDQRLSACNTKAVKNEGGGNGAVKEHLNIAMSLMALILLQRIVNFSKI